MFAIYGVSFRPGQREVKREGGSGQSSLSRQPGGPEEISAYLEDETVSERHLDRAF